MRKEHRYMVAAFAVALAGALAASVVAQRYIPGTESTFPRLKYADSLVSANDRCMVRHAKLNPAVHPVYVNGVPMGFC